MVWERNDVIFDLLQHLLADVERYLELVACVPITAMLILIAQVSYLQFYLAEFGDNVMETITEDRV